MRASPRSPPAIFRSRCGSSRKRPASPPPAFLPRGVRLLREAARLPAAHVDRPEPLGGDPACGLSNHEGPRLEYLRRTMLEIGAVRAPDDVRFNAFGNLEWVLEDPEDDTPRAE